MYECPQCSAGLEFNPKTQMLECKYCNSTFSPEDIEKLHLKNAKEDKGFGFTSTKDENGNEKVDVYDAIIYRCSQCGAELITTDETIATFCSYCGSSAVLEKRSEKKTAPSYIIPFTKTKQECEEIYKRKLKKAFFAPNDMLKTQQVEKIRGIYMPYWVYSFEKDGKQVDRGQRYARRVGDYVYYDDYSIETDVKAKCDGVSHDAASNFADNLSEAIAPFSMKEKQEFSPTYLSGFYADSEDVDGDVYMLKCNDIANTQASNELKKDSTYGRYSSKPHVELENKDTKLGLFPVYFLATRNKQGDRISYAVVNGQTGKIAAEIPIDFKKYLITSLILAVVLFIVFNGFLTLTPTKVTIVSIIFNAVSFIVANVQTTKIRKRELMLDDMGVTNKGIKSAKEKNNASEKGSSSEVKVGRASQIWKPFIGLVIAIALIVLNPVSDLYYYLGAIVSILLTIWSISDLIKGINLLTTRKLPQLERRGGDEHA